MKKQTDELEHMILENKETLESIKINYTSARNMLFILLEEKQITASRLGNALGKSNYIYEIIDNKSTKQPSRELLIAILFYLECDLKIFNEILQKFGHSKIYVKNPYDAYLFYCINNKFSFEETNKYLAENQLKTLI